MEGREGGERKPAGGGRTASLRAAILAALLIGACNREYDGPYVPGSDSYAGDEWTADSDGDGVADSVAKYLPECPREPRECLESAKVLSRIGLGFSLSAADMILWKGAKGVPPRLTWEPEEASVRGSELQSSDTSKVRIRKGLMDAVGAGNAQVSVTVPGESRIASYIVKVVDSGRAVASISAKDMTLEAGAEGIPDIGWTPSDATHREYSLSIDEPSVAWTSGGSLKAILPGKARVTVEALDGGHKTAFTLTVTETPPKVEAVSILAEDMYLVLGAEAEPPAVHWVPSNVTDKRYLLVPVDTAVAAANKSRDRIIPKSVGATPVNLFALDGSGKSATFTVRVSGTAVPVTGLAAADLQLAAGGNPVQPGLVWTPRDATNRRYTLTSDSPHVAAAFGGMVVPIAAGRAPFTAVTDDGGLRARFFVDVALPDTAIHVDSVKAQDMTLAAGQERKPVLTWYPGNAGNQYFTLESSDIKTAYAVGELVHGVSPGEAVFTLTTADRGRKATFTVTVGENVVPVQTVTGAPLTLLIGDVKTPSIAWQPAHATHRVYTLSSGNTAIVRIVDGTRVEAVAVGMADVVILSADGPKDTIRVTVNADAVPVIGLTVLSQTMNVGDLLELAGVIQWNPANATDKTHRIISSSNSAVVSIVENRLRALASGTATVVVESQDAAKARDTFTVAVRQPLKSLSVRDTSVYPWVAEVDPSKLTTWTPADADNKQYSLESLDTAVASVAGAKVRLRNPGVARVVMTSLENATKLDTFRVTVLVPVTGLSVRDTTVKAGTKAVNLGPAMTWTPSNAHDKNWWIEWVGTANASVLTMPEGWYFDAVGPGTARIAVVSSQNRAVRDTITVTVIQPVDSLKAANHSMKVGDADHAPSITWYPSNASDKGYAMGGGAAGIATVQSNKVRAVGPGNATFTVTSNDGGKTAKFTVTVTQPVTGIAAEDITMAKGAESAPSLTWTPSNASNKGYTLTGGNASIAVVSGTKVKAVGAGTTTFTVTAADGGKTDSFNVTVVSPVTAVACSDFSMWAGEPDRAPPLVWTPSDATNRNYSLHSSNPEIASIVGGTLVRASWRGKATITVTSQDGNHQGQCQLDVRNMFEF